MVWPHNKSLLKAPKRLGPTLDTGNIQTAPNYVHYTECVSLSRFASDSPGHLEEKVSQLEDMLKRLQDDLQKVLPIQMANHSPSPDSPHSILPTQ